MAGPNDLIGSKLGPRLARLVSQASVATKAESVPLDVARFMHTQDTFFRLIGAEIADGPGKLYAAAAQHLPAGSWERRFMESLGAPHGQASSIVGMLVNASGAGQSLITVFSDYLAPAVHQLLRDNPTLLLDPGTSAQAAARGVWTLDEASGTAAASGLEPSQFAVLAKLSQSPLALAEIAQLLNRGLIDQAAAEAGLIFAGLAPENAALALHLARQVLSPADLANMVVQAVIDQPTGEQVASLSGVDPVDFDRLVRVTGLPPGPMDGLTMLRRGILDTAAFELLVKQGHTKPEYIPALLALRHQLLSPADAAQMVVQNILDDQQGASLADQWGFTSSDFERMVHVRGRPISPTEAQELYNRGLIDQATFAQAIAESDVKTKYTDVLFKLRRHYPGLFEMRALISSGAISDADAITMITDQGYDHALAVGIVQAAHTQKAAKHRDLAESQILLLWEDGYLQEPQAREFLAKLGWDDAEIGFILDTVTASRLRTFLDAAVGTVKARYTSHQITKDQAIVDLDSFGIPADVRTQYLEIWGLQRDANVRTLTPAQIIQAHKVGLLDPAQTQAKLVQLGYSPVDAAILIDIGDKGPTIPLV